MGRLTELECRQNGVLFFYRDGQFMIRASGAIAQRLKAEIADRTAVLRNAPSLPDNGTRMGACSTCGDAFDVSESGRGGTCAICIAAWRAVIRQRSHKEAA